MRRTFILLLCSLLASAAEAQQFKRVLIPITATNLPGLFGSVWNTELVGFNDADNVVPVRLAPDEVCSILESCPPETAQPHQPFSLPGGAFSQLPQGFFVFVGVNHIQDVRFHLQAYEVARRPESFGASIPVPSEDAFIPGPFSLPGVLIDPAFRTAVRIYGLENVSGTARIRVTRLDRQLAKAELQVQLASQSSSLGLTLPSYVSVPDLAAALPADLLAPSHADAPRVSLEITSITGQHLWAFATVTNNSNQQLSIVSP